MRRAPISKGSVQQEKQQLLVETGIDLKQLTNWFTDARKRIGKPLMNKQAGLKAAASKGAATPGASGSRQEERAGARLGLGASIVLMARSPQLLLHGGAYSLLAGISFATTAVQDDIMTDLGFASTCAQHAARVHRRGRRRRSGPQLAPLLYSSPPPGARLRAGGSRERRYGWPGGSD